MLNFKAFVLLSPLLLNAYQSMAAGGAGPEPEVPVGMSNRTYLNSQFAPFRIDQHQQGRVVLKSPLSFKGAERRYPSRTDYFVSYHLKINKYLYWQTAGAFDLKPESVQFAKGTQFNVILKKLYLRDRGTASRMLPNLDIFNAYTSNGYSDRETNNVHSRDLPKNYKAEVALELVPLNNPSQKIHLESRYFDLRHKDGYSLRELSYELQTLIEMN